jgi:hypothetical protein
MTLRTGMAWPGSQLPAGMKRPRRRRGKGRKRTRPSSLEKLMVKTAISLGVAARPPKTTEGVGRCLAHAAGVLGFLDSDGWSLARFIEDLAARSPGKKTNVRLPSWKTPPGARHVIGVRCRQCAGRGCHRCDMYGWGVRIVVAIKKGACAKHEVAATPAA